MVSAQSRRLALLAAVCLQASSLLSALPARAASALAAWALTSDGVLKLRTATGARLDAFFALASPPLAQRGWWLSSSRVWTLTQGS